jgi:hypothetical protein
MAWNGPARFSQEKIIQSANIKISLLWEISTSILVFFRIYQQIVAENSF